MDIFKEIYTTVENLLSSGESSYRLVKETGISRPTIVRLKQEPEKLKGMRFENVEKLYNYAKRLK